MGGRGTAVADHRHQVAAVGFPFRWGLPRMGDAGFAIVGLPGEVDSWLTGQPGLRELQAGYLL